MIVSRHIYACGLTLALALSASSAAHAAEKKTLGFVIPSWLTAMYETKYYDECPDGLAIGNDELWWKGLSPMDRDKLTNGGDLEPVDPPRRPMSVLRGPNKEDVCWMPEIVKDPPLRVIKGKYGYGFNLDGTENGEATANTCKHEKFVTPDGTTKVDNQMYRILGCIYGWRKGEYVESHADRERRDSSVGMILIEVTDVDDEMNDPDVSVGFYTTRDPLHKDSTGGILPYGSYRIVETKEYGTIAKGKIVDGKLITEATDTRLPLYAHQVTATMLIKGLRMELPVAARPDGKPQAGMIGGYHDFENWYNDYIRRMESVLVTGQWSCPAVYVAAKELADGYPDPETGKCTAISTAMNIEALPAFVIRPEVKAAQAGGQR